MKRHYLRIGLFISPLAASVLLVSCVDPGGNDADNRYSSGSTRGVYTTLPKSFNGSADHHGGKYQRHGDSDRRSRTRDSSGHGVYTSLPRDFTGNIYQHDGRYYSGGNFETGRYEHNGRRYDSRYRYNGQYIYGGRYQSHQGHQ